MTENEKGTGFGPDQAIAHVAEKYAEPYGPTELGQLEHDLGGEPINRAARTWRLLATLLTDRIRSTDELLKAEALATVAIDHRDRLLEDNREQKDELASLQKLIQSGRHVRPQPPTDRETHLVEKYDKAAARVLELEQRNAELLGVHPVNLREVPPHPDAPSSLGVTALRRIEEEAYQRGRGDARDELGQARAEVRKLRADLDRARRELEGADAADAVFGNLSDAQCRILGARLVDSDGNRIATLTPDDSGPLQAELTADGILRIRTAPLGDQTPCPECGVAWGELHRDECRHRGKLDEATSAAVEKEILDGQTVEELLNTTIDEPAPDAADVEFPTVKVGELTIEEVHLTCSLDEIEGIRARVAAGARWAFADGVLRLEGGEVAP